MLHAVKKTKMQKGFTLVEIMVVLVILGILAAISVPVYSNYVNKAKINEAISNVESLANAIRIYKMETGNWPEAKTRINDIPSPISDTISIDEYYFVVTWAKPNSESAPIIMTIKPNKFDSAPANSTCTYTMTADFKGTWNGTLLDKYAPYLTRK